MIKAFGWDFMAIKDTEIKIITLSEFGKKIVNFGSFSFDVVKKLVEIAEKHNMACLGYIDLYDYTYFNEAQAADIKKELEILKAYKEIDEKLLECLSAAADASIKGYDFIRIDGCQVWKYEITDVYS